MAAEAAATTAETYVAVVDGVDGYAGALRVGDGCGDVGAVLVGDAGAAVVGVDAVGDHEDEAGLVGGLLDCVTVWFSALEGQFLTKSERQK